MVPQKPWHLKAAEAFKRSLGSAWEVERVERSGEHRATAVVDKANGIGLEFYGRTVHTATALLKHGTPSGELRPFLKIGVDRSISHASPLGMESAPAERYAKYVGLLINAHRFLERHVPKTRKQLAERRAEKPRAVQEKAFRLEPEPVPA